MAKHSQLFYQRRNKMMAIGRSIAMQLKPWRTQREVGRMLQMTASSVQQIENTALYKIAMAMKLPE